MASACFCTSGSALAAVFRFITASMPTKPTPITTINMISSTSEAPRMAPGIDPASVRRDITGLCRDHDLSCQIPGNTA